MASNYSTRSSLYERSPLYELYGFVARIHSCPVDRPRANFSALEYWAGVGSTPLYTSDVLAAPMVQAGQYKILGCVCWERVPWLIKHVQRLSKYTTHPQPSSSADPHIVFHEWTKMESWDINKILTFHHTTVIIIWLGTHFGSCESGLSPRSPRIIFALWSLYVRSSEQLTLEVVSSDSSTVRKQCRFPQTHNRLPLEAPYFSALQPVQ